MRIMSLEFENRNIFEKINKNIGVTTVGHSDILILPLSILLKNIKRNNMEVKHYINILKNDSKKTYAEIAIESNHKESYLKEIFMISKKRQKRMPSRDCIIGLCFAFELNLKESNLLLKSAGYNELYIRNLKDLIIMKALNDRVKLSKCNEFLCENNIEKIGNLDLYEVY